VSYATEFTLVIHGFDASSITVFFKRTNRTYFAYRWTMRK